MSGYSASPEGPQTVAPLAPSEVDFMPPMLRSLSTLLRLRGKIVSSSFLLAELAGTSSISIGACLRALNRAGMRGSVFSRPTLADISTLALPCLLILDGDRSCVLTALREDEADIILPEEAESVRTVPLDDLESRYAGYAVFVAHETRTDARVEKWRITSGKRWFWDVLRYYMPIYSHVLFASVVIHLIAVASPLFVMNVYDRVVPNNAVETLWVLASGIGLAYVLDFILRGLRNRFVDVAGRNADVVLSSMLMDKVLTMRLDARPESTGALVNNLREFESLRDFFSSSTLLAVIDVPFLFLFLGLVSFIGGPLVFVPLAAMPVLLGGVWLIQARARRAAEQSYKHGMQRNALLVELVNGVETIKSCLAESRMQRLWEAIAGISAQSAGESRRYSNQAVSLATLVTQLVSVALIIWGVYRIAEGSMTMGALIGCNILASRVMAPLMQVAGLLTRLHNSRVSLHALDTLMALPSENQDETSCMDFGHLEPEFIMDKVSFAYPGSTRKVLNGVSLRIRPGERVGVIGRMGSGKSTLGKLFLGLYEPQEGTVKFGGVDIRQLATADLRSRVGALGQEVVLFYGSIRDNIAMGDPSVNDHLILRAATLSGVADFVRDNPGGYGAQVGEQGRALSGGQRQAVGLARALVHDPDVLMLDEPTSNMDTDAEMRLMRRLHTVTRGKTLLLITHRLSLLQLVDRVVVLDNGRVKLDGPRDEVLKQLRETSRAARSGDSSELRHA